MDTSSTTGSDEMIFLHDDEGNDYLVSRSTLKHAQVPPELKSDVENFIKGETSGYDDALAKQVMAYYGMGKADRTAEAIEKLHRPAGAPQQSPPIDIYLTDQLPAAHDRSESEWPAPGGDGVTYHWSLTTDHQQQRAIFRVIAPEDPGAPVV